MSRRTDTVRFALTPDNVRLAWACSGTGPSLVKASNWLTHLEFDRESPVWRHWVEFLAGHFRYYRYDERGNGMSDHGVSNLSADHWLPDLETVVKASRAEPPFILLGISQGAATAIAYAAAHREQVSHLVIYGGYLQGWRHRGEEERRRREAVAELAELGWGKPHPAFRRLYTSMFLPGGSEDQLAWFDELCARTTSPRMAARMMISQGDADFSELASQVSVPTLVMHARDDAIVPLNEGRRIASSIDGAEFIELDSENHILQENEPAWARFQAALIDFTGAPALGNDPVFDPLSRREKEVLAKLAEGLDNTEIGIALFISEKTVRNHVTHIFEKLGVKTRSQAIVMARDRNFRHRA